MNVEQTQQNLIMDVGLKPHLEHPRMDCYFDMSLNNICRVCLEKNQGSKKMCSIFENTKSPQFSHMVMACASVQVIEGDGLPSMICSKCIEILNIAWQFKQQCESSDTKLRQYFGSTQHLQITPDLDSFNIIKEEQSMLPLTHESQYIVQEIVPEIQPPPKQTTLDSTLVMPETMNHLIPDKPHQPDTDCIKKQKLVKKPSPSNFQPMKTDNKLKEPKQHQCDSCGKTFKRREYLTQHIRIHTGEKPYHCHLCEKRFINSGHLTTHMRTHTGERPHGCTLCPKAFSTKQELNKHTMVHSGDRPYICKLCGKRFGSSSNLYSHLKHHTGEKNFTCEHCGKAFYTKQELKQHFVVHTGEKPFLCEFCNRRFSQIAHLRRHSKLHKFDQQ